MKKTNSNYVFGLHTVQQILEHERHRILEIWALAAGLDEKFATLIQQAQQQGLSVHYVPRKTLDKLTQQANHQGIVLRCQPLPMLQENDLMVLLDNLSYPPLLLVLDEVQDPHNLGACLRTADAAGVDGVIVPKNRACGLTTTVQKVACGAAETVAFFQVTNLVRTLQALKQRGIWIIGTRSKAEMDFFSVDLTGPMAIVLGAEGSGLRHLTANHCDILASIPLQGQVASLNVSVANGICLFEAVRQRRTHSIK